ENRAIVCAQSASGKNNVSVCGIMKNAIAKMTGITPAGLTFNGRKVDCGASCEVVLGRFAYWIGILRTACSTNTANAVNNNKNIIKPANSKIANVVSCEPVNLC